MRLRVDKNVLANIFNFLGDALEEFNPSAFRFLSAVLPYLTPVPVAWLTSDSASDFLHFPPWVSFIFVFGLEGIGLWFTSLLVDAVVEWVRSRNKWASFVTVLMFVVAVGSYVFLLVNLNVTLETASGRDNPLLSKVITLICFLPLITGIGNGYYKLKLERKTETEKAKAHDEEVALKQAEANAKLELSKLESQNSLELQKLQEASRTKLELAKLKYENSKTHLEVPKRNGSSIITSGSTSESPKTGRPSVYETSVFDYLDKAVLNNGGVVPTFSDIVRDLKISESTASRLRNKWIADRTK